MGGIGSGRKKSVIRVERVERPKLPRSASVFRYALQRVYALEDRNAGKKWPAVGYQKDPVRFVREVLKERPLRHQRRIMMSVARKRRAKVAVCSGQKCGKTKTEIWLALWFYCCFPDAQVILTAATAPQIKRVIWRELQKTIRDARNKNTDFDIESPAENPETGVVSADGRSIRGFTVRDIEALGGISGANLLFLCDEASSLSDAVAEAITGNTSAGARLFYISNPTRTEGPFFEAFHGKKKYWKTYHLSSEDVANYIEAHGWVRKYPALASAETIRMWEEEYGRDSPFFIVRVLGKFLLNESGKAITLDAITRATAGWSPDDKGNGVTRIGVDPAGPGDEGDEWGFSITRGSVNLDVHTQRGLNEDAAIEYIRDLVAKWRVGDEIPQVVIDSEGEIGSRLYYRMKGISETLKASRPDKAYECFGVRASNRAKRKSLVYDRTREELWANAAKWINDGGTFKGNSKLETELHCPNWSTNSDGRLKITPKPLIREKIGRSPDRADAFLLSVWEPAPWLLEDTQDKDSGGVAAAVAREIGASPNAENPFRRPMGDALTMGGAILGDPYELYRRSGG